MPLIKCLVCSKTYKEASPPKILTCGHSICLTCLNSALEGSKSCPDCSKSLDPEHEYPTNIALLEASTKLLDQLPQYYSKNQQKLLSLKNQIQFSSKLLESFLSGNVPKIKEKVKLLIKKYNLIYS